MKTATTETSRERFCFYELLTTFLKKLEKVKDIPQESLLVTLDVKSLYINVPNNEDIKAVKEPYERYKEKTGSIKVILTFLSLILTLNNFCI